MIAARTLHLVAEAGIADLLANGSQAVEQLAAASQTHPDALQRLLRLLASHGVCREVVTGVFELTDIGQHLRSDHPESVRSMLTFSGRVSQAFTDARHSLLTGTATFPESFGQPFFALLREEPEMGALFNESMAEVTRMDSAAVTEAYDFSEARRVVDLAGGDGTLLTAILEAFPSTAGVLFDQPHMAPVVRQQIDAAGLRERCEFTGGDLFGSLPQGGDVYLLKWILHDWPEPDAIAVLRGCRRAMAPDSKLLIIEHLIPPGNAPHPSKVYDVVMLVLLGGRERTREEYGKMLTEAGLTLQRVIDTGSALSIIEARPA
ncbi:methyltransferase [Streptomyces sp. AC627_RSS907]|uniref:methyltransferase n=1 Tax=Streptomyces sp. AC627_RSS907 TaxID=2823684 RepID=UPI001C22003C|nr:methyltransferase [Streptomyces sp. AC627_RSS907]